MEILLKLFAIFGAVFLIKETSGPFDLMDKLRNYLLTNKYLGPFFYKMFSCYFCLGCDVSLIFYLFTFEQFSLAMMFVWMMAGGAFSLITNQILFGE
jgi:hypothetical protein